MPEIKEITEEIDIPPFTIENQTNLQSSLGKVDMLEPQGISSKQRFLTVRRIFIICLFLLVATCCLDIFATWLLKGTAPDSIDSAIEVLKALLLSMSGYLVARNTEK